MLCRDKSRGRHSTHVTRLVYLACLRSNVLRAYYAPINAKPEGGGGGPRAYVGHLTFQKIFWSKSPPWGPKTGSNKIKYPHLREVISLKFIVVVVYILQIIDINCQAFFLYFKLL